VKVKILEIYTCKTSGRGRIPPHLCIYVLLLAVFLTWFLLLLLDMHLP